MDSSLRSLLTSPRVGCTQEHVDKFVNADVLSLNDAQLLGESDFKELGLSIGTRNRVLQALQQECLPAIPTAPRQRQSVLSYAPSNPWAAASAAASEPAAATPAQMNRINGRVGGAKRAQFRQENARLSSTMRGFLSSPAVVPPDAFPPRPASPLPNPSWHHRQPSDTTSLPSTPSSSATTPSATSTPSRTPPKAAPKAAGSTSAPILDDALIAIVKLFKPGANALKYGAHSVSASAQLRKMVAAFSYESVETGRQGVVAERGPKPTAREIRAAVCDANFVWPWGTPDAGWQFVRRARKDYISGLFDGVAVEGGTRGKHRYHVGRPGPKPKCAAPTT